jgi:4-amino-4-deoxy-L-arabinose transferase-like glycosyltransferase
MSTVTVPGAASARGRGVAVSAGAVADVYLVACLTIVAFIARLAVRMTGGEAAFLANGYSFYLDVARNLLAGQGFCLAPGQGCALRLPLYPAFIAPWMASGWLYPGLVIAQAALGAALVWVAWRIGRDLFDARAGLIAAALAALSPYALIHDTGIQDTVLVNFLIGLAAYLLWQTRHRGAPAVCLAAGVAVGLVMLTTARLTLTLPAIVGWAVVGAGPTTGIRLRSALLIFVPIALMLGGWIVRNVSVVGAPVLTTESGESLWVANNPWAMSHFPARSIDLSVGESYARLSPSERAAFEQVEHDDLARNRLLQNWALGYIAEHPGLTVTNAIRKVWVPVSAQLSPARSAFDRWSYAAIYAPLHLLAAIALWRHRVVWREHALMAALLLSFVVTTAVFWAHTSHKSYLDVFLFVYAGAVLGRSTVRAAA